MGKTTDAGIDVSKAVLDVAVRRDERQLETARCSNDPAGHKALVRWLTKGGRTVRVVLESTATYSLDVALALHRTRGIAVMVANPRAIKQFTGALMQRSKTDLTAAVALRDYAIRMPFVAWQPPAAHVLELRGDGPSYRGPGRRTDPRAQSPACADRERRGIGGRAERHRGQRAASRAPRGVAGGSGHRAHRCAGRSPVRLQAPCLRAWDRDPQRRATASRAARAARGHDRPAVGRSCRPRSPRPSVRDVGRQA